MIVILKARIKKLEALVEARQRALSYQRGLEQASLRVQEAVRDTYTWVTEYTETFNEHWVVEGRPWSGVGWSGVGRGSVSCYARAGVAEEPEPGIFRAAHAKEWG